jgi:hypothetical protein
MCTIALQKFPMKKILIALLALVLIAFVYLLTQGLMQRVHVEQRTMPGYRIVGVEHVGPYEKIGDSFERVHKIADENGVNVHMIGVYFDNPNEVSQDSLRSLAGLIVSEADSMKLSAVPGLKMLSIPPGNAAASTFETGGMVSMIIGAMKSYPELTEYVMAKGVAEDVVFVYEVYEEGKTEYVMQLAD